MNCFKKISLLVFVIFCNTLHSQEICNNGIDDDGDGLVDCYDTDCNGNLACTDFFYGKSVVSCSMSPTNPNFNLNTLWQSTVNVSTRSTMMVGDVDGDGTPEVVCHQDGINQLYILDGITGSIEVTINCPAIADYADAITIGDTDHDGLGEIYVITNDNVLRCFENNGAPKAGFVPITTSFTQESVPGIADFNQDGVPEIYKDNRIYNALTGALIAAGSGSTGNNNGSNGSPASMPVAADVLPASYCGSCAGLELICGNQVYAVDIVGGVLTPISNSLPSSLKDGFTSIADMNHDGKLDVVVSSNGKVYMWDPRLGTQIGNTYAIPNTTAGGRANIGDYDNDGLPEIGVGGENRYAVIDVDSLTGALTQKWVNIIVDGSAHTTGSVFDFDCDGKSEVVYRDENNLYIWDGATGNTHASIQCGSGTRSEFPTIVDVDGDGQVNIVCACSAINQGSVGVVKAFNSSTNQWVASRKVMNQHSYFVVNINDNLSVPIQQQNHALLPKLIGFLSQAPIFDVGWGATCIPLPDLKITTDTLIYCQHQDSITIGFTTCNIGNKIINTPVSIAVYNSNPLQGGSLVYTSILNDTIPKDSCLRKNLTIAFTGTDATYYLYVNDDGSSPLTAPKTAFIECDSSNNGDSIPIHIPVITLSISGDTSLCLNESSTFFVTGAISYVWQPAGALNSNIGSTVTCTPSSTITFTVTGTDTLNGCYNKDSIKVNVYQNPFANFGTTKVCNGSATVFNDSSVANSGIIANWNWSFGDTVYSNSPSPTHTFDSAGFFQTQLIVNTNHSCSDTVTKTTQVFYNPVAEFAFNDVCFGDTVSFINLSSIRSPSVLSSYLWNWGDNSASSTMFESKHTYGNYGTFVSTLIVVSSDSCTNAITHSVNVYDSPKSKFTFSNSCVNDSVVFTNISATPSMGTIAHFLWSFGESSPLDSVHTNPAHLYVSDGSYIITLITNSSNLGCADTLSDTIAIYPVPIANYSLADVCLSQPTQFTNSSTVLNDTITHWIWSFGDSSPTDTVQNPTHNYLNFGQYATSLTCITSNGCSDTFSLSTIVHPLPQANFTKANACFGAPVSFANTSNIPANISYDSISTFAWNLGENNITSTLQAPSHTYSDSGTFNVQLLIRSTFGCVDSVFKTVVINPLPVVVFSSPDTLGCEPKCVTFHSSSYVINGNVSNWEWNFGDGSPISSSQDAMHCYVDDSLTNPVQYSPTLKVTSDSGCVQTLTKTNYVTVFPSVITNFSSFPLETSITDPVIALQNTSINADTNIWSFGDGLDSIVIQPQNHAYKDTGSYTITLIGISNHGCKDTFNTTVYVHPDFIFYVPNAFTPNEDGVNDTFAGKGIYIKEFDMQIFDRWGNLIYSSDNIDKPWDGKANKGSLLAQADVYVYSIHVMDYKSQKHTYTGIVTLVR